VSATGAWREPIVAEPRAQLEVLEQPERAAALLDPTRRALLEALRQPESAAGLARALGLPRQRVNYHLRELERHGLVELVVERRRGSARERRYRRSASAYAISGAALGELAADPAALQDRASSAYQIARAARTIQELAVLRAAAAAAGQRLPTFALDVEVAFASAAARSAFAEELTQAVADLVRKHHDAAAAGARTLRVYLGAYPRPR
jgi:DNA-binding transcriptional ArsR family regulator